MTAEPPKLVMPVGAAHSKAALRANPASDRTSLEVRLAANVQALGMSFVNMAYSPFSVFRLVTSATDDLSSLGRGSIADEVS
jgi:hypothetical protein